MNDRMFEGVVRRAVEGLPDQFKDALQNIDIVIEEFPDPELLEEYGIEPPLLGLYEGIPLTERELGEVNMPDRISLYRGEFMRMGLRGKDLVEEIRITVLHEIGHYFGLDDEQMEEMGY